MPGSEDMREESAPAGEGCQGEDGNANDGLFGIEVHHTTRETIGEGVHTVRDSYGGEVDVDYPDGWDDGPTTGGECTADDPTGDDSRFTARGEVYTEESRTVDGGTVTDTTAFGTEGSWQ
ncbi:hypothetical protein ABZZ17_07570 [Streptomyces sp. NPDC006512]|uniref:hypothetical protein n=1 Tax=Streptomyces sp. NPDC006512 TaxID=3154307 RepID=UPI0033BA9177